MPERIEAPPAFRERLELKPPGESSSDLPEGLSFQLAPDRNPRRYDYSPDEGPDPGTKGVRGLIRPGLPRYSGRGAAGSEREAGAAPPSRSTEVTRRADIAGWADRAVAAILENWQVPHLLPDQEQDEFEVSVVVQKDGWISSAEIVSPARIPVLQAAALKALEVSSPLPRLPRSYPEKSLEIRLVFARR